MSSAAAGPSRPPVKPPVVQPSSGNAIIINPCQRLNPILECIRNVNKEFGDIVPDFQLGRTTCALFLSLKYHRLHPEYIHQRIQKIGNTFNLRILLLMCDIDQHQEPIRELTKVCLINNMTVMVCWSPEEAGTYLATYKAFEHKSADIIKERVDKDYNAILRSALTSINKVNKMDVETLRAAFGSFSNISRATTDQLRPLPGFGQVKVRRVKDAFEKPFRNKATSSISESFNETSIDQSSRQLPVGGPSTRVGSSISDIVRDEQREDGPSTSTRASPSKTPGTHRFGSAADMPPPPVPSSSRSRHESPPWDIELDMIEDAPSRSVGSVTKDVDDVTSVEGKEPVSRLPRSPSPVWDIELDLNED